MYPCSRCAGTGEIPAHRAVIGGVCFRCHGTGTQRSKPSTPKPYQPPPRSDDERGAALRAQFALWWHPFADRVRRHHAALCARACADHLARCVDAAGLAGRVWHLDGATVARVYVRGRRYVEVGEQGGVSLHGHAADDALTTAIRDYSAGLTDLLAYHADLTGVTLDALHTGIEAYVYDRASEEPIVLYERLVAKIPTVPPPG